MDGRKCVLGVRMVCAGVGGVKWIYDPFWKGQAISVMEKRQEEGYDTQLEFLAGPDNSGSPGLSCGVWTLFYKLAVHSLLGSVPPSNSKTFVDFEVEKITFRQHSRHLQEKKQHKTKNKRTYRIPTPSTTIFIFACYLLVVIKHHCICMCLQSIYISFSLPSRSKPFSRFLCCPLLIIRTAWERYKLSQVPAALSSGEAKMCNPKIPSLEQLGVWYSTSAEMFNHTHFKACGFALMIRWKMYSVLWRSMEGFLIPFFCAHPLLPPS